MPKKENTFKFVSFHERIEKTHVDVIRRYKAYGNVQPTDAETFFSETLEKWSDLNGTAHFDDFKHSIPRSNLRSYAQVLHCQKELTSSLQVHLKVENSLCLQALLDLTVALCRDLQEDFNQYFWPFFDIIKEILNNTHSDKADVIEACFSCYAYLFKFCRRYLISELEIIIVRLLPLISSKKYYIRRFVSESLAYLIRKFQKFDKLLNVCLTLIKENAQTVQGISDLFVESMRTVRFQMNSVTSEIYSALLNVCDQKFGEHGFRLTKVVTEKVVKSIKSEYLEPIFRTLLQYSKEICIDQTSPHHLEQCLELWMVLSVGNKNSNPLQSNFKEICEEILIPILSRNDKNSNFISDRSLKLSLSFIDRFWPPVSRNVIDNRPNFDHMLRVIFIERSNAIPVDLLVEFLESLIIQDNFHEFRSVVLPKFVDFTEFYFKTGQNLSPDRLAILHMWAKICNRNTSISDDSNDVYLSKFVGKLSNFVKSLKLIFKTGFIDSSNLHTTFACLAVYSSFDLDRSIVSKLFATIFDKITSKSMNLLSTDSCFLLYLTVKCLKTDEKIVENLQFGIFIDHLRLGPDFLPLLNLFYEVLCKFPSKLKSTFSNEELYHILESNFLSSNGSVRLVTVQILTVLDWTLSDPEVEQNVFDIALQAELTPLTLQNYRDRLLYYRKLGFVEYERYLPEPTNVYRFAPLKILIGQLTVNFTLLFPTLNEMIESHARGQVQNEFWQCFGGLLASAHESIQSIPVSDLQIDTLHMDVDMERNSFPDKLNKYWKGVIVEQFGQSESEYSSNNNTAISRYQFRLMLWNCMEKFADLAESKSRYLVESFLYLVQSELISVDENACSYQDITLDSNPLFDKKQLSADIKRKTSILLKTLISCLNVFSKFTNPQSVSKETKLKIVYFDLLLYGRNDVQKAALECVLTYKSKPVSPYRENLLNLLDDKLFKDELISFNIDSQANVLNPEHRNDVMPIVLRIAYGRLFGKGSDAARKQQIYRFLSGCTEEELQSFFQHLFLPLQQYLDPNRTGTLSQVCSSIIAEFDCKKSIPFRKLQGILSHLSMVIKRLGPNLVEYRSMIYRICCICGSILLRIKKNKQSVQPYFVKFSKKLGRLLLRRLTEFYTNFDNYSFCEEEIRSLFEICIWPAVENLHKTDETASISNDLVKFCVALSEIPRYFILFGMYSTEFCAETLLDMLIRRLLDKDCQKSVKDMLSSTLFNLITLSDHEPNDDNGPPVLLPSRFDVKLSEICISDENINYGTKLILPYIDRLLTYLSDRVTVVKLCKDEKWMKILLVLSDYTTDSINSQRLSLILLSIVKSKFIKNAEIESNMLLIVYRLLRHVTCVKDITTTIVELFSIVDNRSSRDNLTKIFQKLVSDCNDSDLCLQRVARVVEELNSWSPNRLDEPDFERRSMAFNELNKIFKSDYSDSKLDLLGLSILVHNCGYFLLKIIDFSLRDLSSTAFQHLIETLCRRFEPDSVQTFFTQHVLPLVRIGLKAKDEAIRHEFITILALCVSRVPDHPKLIGLSKLSDMSDPDLNFFENVRHIQLHRRSRAVKRLCENLDPVGSDESRIQSEVLFNFVWPICYSFIFDPLYRKRTNLIEESVRFLGSYCRRSPWKRYQSMLKYFLQLLKKDVERQKLLIKVLVEVLNSFPYDISSVETKKTLPRVIDIVEEDEQQMEVDKIGHPESSQTEQDRKRKIFNSVVNEILPELQNSLSKRTSTEFVHKTAAKFVYDEDEEILRVPLALAIVKLLQKLPVQYLEASLPGVVAKVCQMLKSRSWDIRETTRNVLCKTASSLGARYIPYIVREMRDILRRGYQTHVLTYSVHVLLNSLVDSLSPGDLEPCLSDVIQICYDDLFGDVSAEKEVDEITKRLKEAKSNKTNATYQIIGRLVEYNSLNSVISPFKEVLNRKYSHKVVQKVGEALKFFAQGMICNVSFDVQSLMTFVHKILSENVTDMLLIKSADNQDENEFSTTGASRASCYDLEKEPPRSGMVPKKSKNNSLHVLVSFGLEILHNLLKRKRLEHENQQHCSLLDPFLTLLIDCTNAKQPKVISTALRCLCWCVQFSLPSLASNCTTFVQRLFLLLKRYAGIGAAGASAGKGENFELITMLFKTITLVIKDVDFCNIDDKKLKILLHYAEEDLLDIQKQSTAFALLKAIISRKLICDDIKTLMGRVEELSIVSQIDTVRQQCRQLIFKYMSLYPEGRRPKRMVEFFCSQLEYEYEEGRMSALEMLNTFVDMFSTDNIDEYCLLIFVHLSLRLVNDESPKLKQTVSIAVKNLLSKLNPSKMDIVFRMIYEWLAGDKVVYKKLAAHLFGLINEFVDVGSVSVFLSALIDCLKSVSSTVTMATDDDSSRIALYDHTTYLTLVAMEKYLQRVPSVIRDAKYTKLLNDIWDILYRLVDHPHVWVRLAVCRLYGLLLSNYKPDELLCPGIKSDEYFLKHPKFTVKQLCDSFLRRFRVIDCSVDLSEQVIKNLVFLARCQRRMTQSVDTFGSRSTTPTEEEAVATLLREESTADHVTVDRLANQLIRVCRMEVSKQPGQCIKRTNVFKWIAAICLDSSVDEFSTLLPIVLPSLHREMEMSTSDSTLKQLASEVLEIIKLKIGTDELSMNLAKVKKGQNEKRLERKRKLADEAVANPDKAARRKIRKHQLQSESRKKKILTQKTGRNSKKMSKSFHLNIEDD